jgi:Rne/Rng family ribonuclease
MSKELVISANRHETRVAVLDEDQLVEVHFQRSNEYSLAGSIHKGRVTRVLPGMQSAFVDVGLERDTFLYVSDFLEEHEDIDRITGDERPPRAAGDSRDQRDQRDQRDRGRDRDRPRRRDWTPDPSPSLQPPPLPPSAEGGAPAVEAPELSEIPHAPESSVEAPEISASPALAGPPVVLAGAPARVEEHRGPAGERGERGGDRGGDRGERRGRRSRRRRNQGRGFPDSKYAPAHGAPAAERGPMEGRDAVREPVRAAVPETVSEVTEPVLPRVTPLVLPGESLAKYRHAAPTPESAPVDDKEEVFANEFDEPVDYPPENALPDAPTHFASEHFAPAATEEAEDEAAPPPAILFSELPPPLPPLAPPMPPSAEIEATRSGSVADNDDSGPAVASILDEDEDRDIQAMILGETGVDIDIDEDASTEEEGTGAEAAEGAEAAGSEPAGNELASGSAQVRERGGRYPHRVSRRNRRRGGRGPQGAAPETRPESRDRAEARPEARPEPRHDPRAESRERTVARPVALQPSISDLLKEGQEIIVQIAKEPLGQKGARITSHIALPGRYVVYMPTLEHMGVSRKIASDEERHRLKRILQAQRPGPTGGFITRTAAEGRTEEEIGADMQFLYNLWQDIRTKSERKPAPLLLHHDLDIVQRILRDQLADSFKAIWIDNEDTYEGVLRFVERFQPALVGKVKLYTREAPIFDAFGVTAELEKALRPKVWLKSGGYIVINQTEALVAIDVNTGKFVGKSNRLEDTIVKTNTEAIKEIVRQIRLRDLGGIIVIDFIDMDERKNRQKVMQALEEAMRVDRAPYKILQFNDFGLVAITRKRVKQSLERTLCSPCPHCDGAGYVKSVQTVVTEILTEARKLASSIESKDVMLRVHPDVAKVLKSSQNKYLEELEEVMRRPVLVKSDPLLHHEKFDLA